MRLTRDISTAITPAYAYALPGEHEWCVARIKCRDGSLYILASQNLSFTFVRLAQARMGLEQVEGFDGKMKSLDLTSGALGIVTTAGGLDRLDGFIRCSDKASAMSLAKSWKEAAVKRGIKLVEETVAEAKGIVTFGDSRTNAEKGNF
jgi:hypothetical protein